MITIRRATMDDKPEIFCFLEKAYEGVWQYKIPERWEWVFVNNPCVKKGELPVFIAVEDSGKVVGESCAMLEEAKIGDEFYTLGWAVDTVVLPEYRGQGLASKLQKINDESQQFYIALWMESVASRKIKMKLGSVDMEPVPVYRRYQKFTPDIFRFVTTGLEEQNETSLKQKISNRLSLTFLNRFVSLYKNNWQDFWDRKINLKRFPGLVLTEVEIFPEDVDLLWEKLCPKFHAIVKRDRRHLNWKYVEQPHMDHHRIIARREGKICGYIVFRKDNYAGRNVGIISDLFVDPDDDGAMTALLSFAVTYFRKQKATEIITATTVPGYQQNLRKLGFVKTGESYPTIHARVNSPAIEKSLKPGMWFLGRSDHDWDQYPYRG